MRPITARIAWLPLLALLVLPAAARTDEAKTSPAPRPRVAADAFEHSFGEVKPGTPLDHTFVIRNAGDADLRISRVKAACGCTTASYDSLVSPGGTGTIRLTIKNTATYKGEVVKTATVTTNDPDLPTFKLRLRAVFPAR